MLFRSQIKEYEFEIKWGEQTSTDDHRRGNSDISFRNCQLLCLECHRAKTKNEAREPKRRSKISKTKERNEARKMPSLKKQQRSKFKVPKIRR